MVFRMKEPTPTTGPAQKPIIPIGEGNGIGLSMRYPQNLVARLDSIAKATGNTRTSVIMHLLRWALEQYESNPANRLARRASK